MEANTCQVDDPAIDLMGAIAKVLAKAPASRPWDERVVLGCWNVRIPPKPYPSKDIPTYKTPGYLHHRSAQAAPNLSPRPHLHLRLLLRPLLPRSRHGHEHAPEVLDRPLGVVVHSQGAQERTAALRVDGQRRAVDGMVYSKEYLPKLRH